MWHMFKQNFKATELLVFQSVKNFVKMKFVLGVSQVEHLSTALILSTINGLLSCFQVPTFSEAWLELVYWQGLTSSRKFTSPGA